MSLLGWLFGRGRNPLEVPDRDVRAAPEPALPVVAVAEEDGDERRDGVTRAAVGAPASPELDSAVAQQAQAMGVTPETYRRMVVERRALVEEIAADPRAFGFDLVPAGAQRRDAAAEYRRRVRMTGALGDSFLTWFEPLMALVPDPPTMPDGTPLDRHLQEHARLDADAAKDIAHHVRTTIQSTLGAPLDQDAVEHAVREAAWDNELDAATVAPLVLRALDQLL